MAGRHSRQTRRGLRVWISMLAGVMVILAIVLIGGSWLSSHRGNSSASDSSPIPASSAAATVTASGTASGSSGATLTAAGVATPAPAPRRARVATLAPAIDTLPAPKPAKTLTGPRNLPVPILMYHVIGTAPVGAANPDLYVRPQDFADQMRYLSTHGYHAVTLQQVYDFWKGEGTLPSKPVVLSFDDGDTPDFTIVAPLLKQLDWPGVMFLIVGRHNLRLKPTIVRALLEAGWEIDSHTVTHTDVPGLPASQLKFEIADSRTKLQKLYNIPVNFFCYPSGRFDDNAVAAVKAAGYLGATTTLGGLAKPSQMYLLRRVRISGGQSVNSFAALIRDAR